MKRIKLGIVMDPIQNICVMHDSTLRMMMEAQSRGWELYYMEPNDLYLENGIPAAFMKKISVALDQNILFANKFSDNGTDRPENFGFSARRQADEPAEFTRVNEHGEPRSQQSRNSKGDGYKWFSFEGDTKQNLNELDVILMRKDPPVDLYYFYLTYILEQAERQGVLVVNRPSSLREVNEKLFTSWFSEFCPKTLVSSNMKELKSFLKQIKKGIIKPLNAMGGYSIFFLKENDPNCSVILETMTRHETELVMMQEYIPEIEDGDKRIIMIDGKSLPYVLARIPSEKDFRGNLAAGAKFKIQKLNTREKEIAEFIGPILSKKSLLLVGLDIIGHYLTEINVTSPTCLAEIDDETDISATKILIDAIEGKLN